MNTIEIKVSVDTGPIDSLITKLERAVELQKQLTQEPLQTKKATLANLIDITPAVFGVVVSWNVWWPGKVRVYSKYRRGDETIEMCSRPISNSYQSYLVNNLPAGQDTECHVRFYDNDGGESFRSNTVTGKANSDASEILNAMPFAVDTGQTYSLRAGIHIDSFILGGTVAASTIESSLASIKELQENVAAIIATAIENQQYIERVNHQRENDFVAPSKAVRSVEESISQLSHRDSFIR
ncbi:TPA: hypothetical protein PXJ63_004499 [Yersinia enterocolitica]|nr:hypothetical protein [Yersinia enterocolitica]HDL6656386.1 hypothetical protein [Yersinia enterocolitica]HDL6681834.1 hypothetical protein [Yersinia enterocolitica]HDL6700271.1 hypothetical protein [Yersinia enterocolitica]